MRRDRQRNPRQPRLMFALLLPWVAAPSACTMLPAPAAAPAGPVVTAHASATVTAQEIEGHWTGNWGDLVLHAVGGEVWGAYSHDQGTVVCHQDADGVLRGWWAEVPSRAPDHDAGEVEFRFVRGADGLSEDGRWRYGTAGDWREDWDLHWVSGPAAPELEQRFAEATAFRRHP